MRETQGHASAHEMFVLERDLLERERFEAISKATDDLNATRTAIEGHYRDEIARALPNDVFTLVAGRETELEMVTRAWTQACRQIMASIEARHIDAINDYADAVRG